MKKIVLMLIAVMVLTLPFQQLRADAIGVKVATKVATQAVKEVVKDMAKEKAFQMALDEVGKIYDVNNKYKFKEGFDGYCVEVKKPDGSCDKPVQIKKDINDADTNKLDGSVTKKLDAKIGGTLYATKWGKFMDWIVPLYAISAAGVMLDYAINQEDSIAGMLNEVAMEALEDAGIVQPVTTLAPVLKEENGTLVDSPGEFHKEEVAMKTVTNKITFPERSVIGTTVIYEMDTLGDPSLLQRTYAQFGRSTYSSWSNEFNTSNANMQLWNTLSDPKNLEIRGTTLLKNGEIIYEGDRAWTSTGDQKQFPGGSNGRWLVPESLMPKEPIKEIWVQHLPDKVITSYLTFSGIFYTMQAPYNNNTTDSLTNIVASTEPNAQVASKITMYTRTVDISHVPYEPIWADEVPLMANKPIEQSNFYNTEEKKIFFPPMDSVGYIDETTGEPVSVVKNPETGESSFTDKNDVPISEDSIGVVPGTGFSPNPNGEGMVYTPTNPTPENPGKDTTVINPTNPVTPPPVEPPPVDEPPAEPFPEGEKCDAKLKFPIFSPLKETFSTSFPFSIPWDIERAINAAFGGISDEKPGFILALPFMGEDWQMEITTPAMFDKWKPFTDTFLLLTFDVLIMFGIFRFVKGAGS